MKLWEYGYLLEGVDEYETGDCWEELAAAALHIENPEFEAALEAVFRRAGFSEDQIQKKKEFAAMQAISLAFADWRLGMGIDDGYYD